uniref:Uncharacterized protein n=1 Tax=Opuntia streptacantha TaxID=393608 RepID=A0A7C9EP57_OPUST
MELRLLRCPIRLWSRRRGMVARKVKNEPSSWLDVFSKPPLFKVSALMKKFSGQKQALAAVSYSFLRCSKDTSNKCKPVGSFIVCDPSGHYWEEFARSLSQMLFDTSDVSVRMTLSESDSTSE